MNLVCYPHFAAGGLICNILNNQPLENLDEPTLLGYGEHDLFIGDNWDIYDQYSIDEFNAKYNRAVPNKQNLWVGTHCHPRLVDYTKFDVILLITTESLVSKLYRWLRVYNLRFKTLWADLEPAEHLDKMRATAKSYMLPFYKCNHPNAVHIEFSDIVDRNPKFLRLANQLRPRCDLSKLDAWLKQNNFLYDFYNTDAYKLFMQAEYEVSTGTVYEFQ